MLEINGKSHEAHIIKLTKKDLKNFNTDDIKILSSFMNGELIPIKDKKINIYPTFIDKNTNYERYTKFIFTFK